MLGELLAGLEATALARALRHSVWIYPLVNAAHVLGVALLIGAIVPLDLRLLGVWRAVPLGPLWEVLSRSAAVGLILSVAFGALLFVTRATEYAQSELFLGKMIVIAIGLANVLALRAVASRKSLEAVHAAMPLPRRVRAAAVVSMCAWLTALILGRLVGYF
jgi:hypothetical protein